jgi:hypothetical protein
MSKPSKIPKRLAYIIRYNGTDYELKTDPQGWEETAIGFSRSSDFGNNAEFAIPLKFSLDGRVLLNNIYAEKDMYSYAEMIIEKRNNDYQLEYFYKYELDFTTYKDDTKYVTIAGKEIGLFSKVETFNETEYDIPLPATDKLFITYKGVKMFAVNSIQVGFGDCVKIGSSGFNFSLRGNRASRAFIQELSFTDLNGKPYETSTLRAVQDYTFVLKMRMNVSLRQKWFFTPETPVTTMRLSVYDLDNNKLRDLKVWTPTSVKNGFIWGTETEYQFNSFYGQLEALYLFNEDISVTLAEGEVLRLMFTTSQDTTMRVTEALESVMDIEGLTVSPFDDLKLQVFPFTYLISELIKKIDPSGVLVYDERVLPYLNMLSCTDAIKGMKRSDKSGVVRSSLQDALKALNAIECIGVDFKGNVMRIQYRGDCYKQESYNGVLKVNQINVSADNSHSFNDITIGWKTEYTKDRDGFITQPFLEKKTFMVKDAKTKNSLEVVSPYIGDPYDIENYIYKVHNNPTTTKEHRIIQLACVNETQVVDDVLPEFIVQPQSQTSNTEYVVAEIEHNPEVPILKPKFGLLYNQSIARSENMGLNGFDTPTYDDCVELLTLAGGENDDLSKYKSTDSAYWNAPNSGAENLFGLDLRGGGNWNGSTFVGLKIAGGVWHKTGVIALAFGTGNAIIELDYPTSFFSLRLTKPATTEQLLLDNGTRVEDYTDFEGNRYVCRKIGSKIWMCENLITKFTANGLPITGGWKAYDDDEDNAYVQTNYVGLALSGSVQLQELPDSPNSFFMALGLRQKGTTGIGTPIFVTSNGLVYEELNITTTDKVEFTVGEGGMGTYKVYDLPKGVYELVTIARWIGNPIVWGFTIDGVLVTKTFTNLMLYKNQLTYLFKGNGESVFNLPYSAQRLAQKHLSYLAISTYKLGSMIEFEKTETDTNMASVLFYEPREQVVLSFNDSGYDYENNKITFTSSVNDIVLGAVLTQYNGSDTTQLNYVIDINKTTKTLTFNQRPPTPISGANYLFLMNKVVTENINIDARETDVMFLPATIEVQTDENLTTLDDIHTNRYGFYKFYDEKRGKSYEGWINNITFAIGKKQSQQWELQAKQL